LYEGFEKVFGLRFGHADVAVFNAKAQTRFLGSLWLARNKAPWVEGSFKFRSETSHGKKLTRIGRPASHKTKSQHVYQIFK
jgi:hypothetical protein